MQSSPMNLSRNPHSSIPADVESCAPKKKSTSTLNQHKNEIHESKPFSNEQIINKLCLSETSSNTNETVITESVLNCNPNQPTASDKHSSVPIVTVASGSSVESKSVNSDAPIVSSSIKKMLNHFKTDNRLLQDCEDSNGSRLTTSQRYSDQSTFLPSTYSNFDPSAIKTEEYPLEVNIQEPISPISQPEDVTFSSSEHCESTNDSSVTSERCAPSTLFHIGPSTVKNEDFPLEVCLQEPLNIKTESHHDGVTPSSSHYSSVTSPGYTQSTHTNAGPSLLKSEDFPLEVCLQVPPTPITEQQDGDVTLSKTPIKSFECSDCGKKFLRASGYKRHMVVHTGEKKYACTLCSKTFTQRGALQVHMKGHSGDKEFKCTQCDKSFVRETYLINHMRMHNNIKPYECHECGKSFCTNSHLKQHLKIHLGEKPFECDECSSRFTQQGALYMHKKIHRGEKPHACNICDKAFLRSTDLRQHVKTHSGVKPHECTECGLRFTKKQSMERHYKLHTGERPYVCVVCQKRFIQLNNLTRHFKVHVNAMAGSAAVDFFRRYSEYVAQFSNNVEAGVSE